MEDVGKVPNLVRRRAVYRCRMRCPKHLLREGVPPEKSISLRTKERSAALERLPAARVELMEFFQRGAKPKAGAPHGIVRTVQRLQRPDDPALPLLTIAEAQKLAREFFATAVAELDLDCALLLEMTPDRRADWQMELEDRIASLLDSSAEAEDPALGIEITLLRRAGRRAPYVSDESRLLREYIRQALRQLWTVELERSRGNFTDDIREPLFMRRDTPEQFAGPARARVAVTLGAAIDRYWAELAAKARTEKTQDRYKAEIAHIAAFFGREKDMGELRRADCIAFRDTFALLPPNFTKLKRTVDLASLVGSRKSDDPVLAHHTLKKYLDALSRFTRWAHKEDLLEKDYGHGLEPLSAKPDGSMAKLPFETDELVRCFGRPLYTGCADDEYGFATPGPNIIRRARYWAPLISLFGGLRSGELLQLTPAHFRVSEAGTPFIVLTKDMKLKNENAEREIPVHPYLIDIGLVEWVDRRRRSSNVLLFPEIEPDKYGSRSSPFGKRFRSDLKHMALGNRRDKLTFHSFRHTFKRALDREDISEQEKDELCGWARAKKTGRRYGVGLEADRLRRPIELVSYPLPLSHLMAHAELVD